jgi:origin recognition complex subunit 1
MLTNADACGQVIGSRLATLEIFDSNALELCARKVAAVSGDVRKALQICRHACDLARADAVQHVALRHIELAIKQVDIC